MNNVVQFLIKMQASVGNVLAVANHVQSDLNRIEVGARRVGTALKKAFSFQSFQSSLMSIPGMEFLLNPYTLIAGGVAAVTKLGAEAEMTATAFTTLVGDGTKAKNMLAEITKFADETPFDKLQLTKNAQQMLNFGVESNKVMGYLKQLGDISGGDAERFSSLSLVFGQVSAAGKLAGQDLMQFIGAGFNPLKELEAMTGKSYQELQDMMSKGQITAENVAQAIAHATGEGGKFHDMMKNTSTTTEGLWSTAIGNIQTMFTDLFSYIQPFIQQFLAGFNTVLPYVTSALKMVFSSIAWGVGFIIEWKDELMLLAGIVASVTVAVNAMSIYIAVSKAVIGGVTLATQAWAAMSAVLNTVLSMNPIGIVIAAIGALVAIGIYCWNKFAGFRAFLLTMWDTMKGFGNVIKTYVVNRINELLGAVGNVGKALKLLFSGDFSGAAQAIGNAARQFSGVQSAANAVAGVKAVAGGISGNWARHQVEQNKAQEKKRENKISTPGLSGSNPVGEVVFGKGRGKDGKKGGRAGKDSKSAEAIATGGQRNKSINMTIGKFFDNMNVHMMDKTDTSELQRIILETLNRSLAIATSTDR